MSKSHRKKKYSDAMDALSAMSGGQEQAPEFPQPFPSPDQPRVEPPSQQPEAPISPPSRPEQPAPAVQRPAAPDVRRGSPGGMPVAKAMPAFPASRTGHARPTARARAGHRQPTQELDFASYNYRQTMIPILLTLGVLVLIAATILSVQLPSGGAKDPTGMTMPPHPMLAASWAKWLVLAFFPVGAGLLFGAFMFIIQVGKQPPPERAAPKLRRHDRGRQIRRR